MNQYDDKAFEGLVENILEETWEFSPFTATFMGIHKYDHLLDQVDKETRKAYLVKQHSQLALLDAFKYGRNINSDNLLDVEILQCNLKTRIATEEMFNRFERDPSLYPNMAIFACLILVLREFLPIEERCRALISRLREIPRFLAEAKENLMLAETIPSIWLDMAREMTISGQKYFAQLVIPDAPAIAHLKDEVATASALALKAFDDYLQFLNEKLSRKPQGSFAAGREYFDFLLSNYHLLPYTSEELETIGLEYIEKTSDEMRRLAVTLEPRKTLTELIEEIKRDAPLPAELLDHYRSEVIRTRQFIVKNDLVSIPDGESLEIMETPLSERSILPYAAYMPPAPFEETQRGFFWVTPPDSTASIDRQKEQLFGHNKAAIEVRTLHEGYPGHHLQFCFSNRLKSKVRRVFGTSVFIEGWALYCEELMKQKGFFTSAKTELIQLKDQLWRACRVVIDVRLHTGRFDFDEAVEMLVRTALIERYNAEAEVRRYSQEPTQPMSYLMGRIEIEKLSGDFRRQYPTVTLCDFHNRLLSFGAAPVSLIRRELLGTRQE